jgi:hypothetical protein
MRGGQANFLGSCWIFPIEVPGWKLDHGCCDAIDRKRAFPELSANRTYRRNGPNDANDPSQTLANRSVIRARGQFEPFQSGILLATRRILYGPSFSRGFGMLAGLTRRLCLNRDQFLNFSVRKCRTSCVALLAAIELYSSQ